eukprot:gb/GECH01012827.1/.p1 GENE.gb/GECH01012827.1/~~gb/GECH01012827.1/.p1  ORF type:complete len:1045 (+),score=173.93 gb/GECH01012827.1/:1-3135(+)
MLMETTNHSGMSCMSVFPVPSNSTPIDLQQENKRETLKRPFPFSDNLENNNITPPKKQQKCTQFKSFRKTVEQKKQFHNQLCRNSCSISIVPEHILCFIFSFLSQKELISSAMSISTKWRKLARSPSLWHTIDFNQFSVLSLPQISLFLENIFGDSSFPFQGIIQLPNSCRSLTAQSFQKLNRVCPRLRGIKLPSLRKESLGITNTTLKHMASFSNLEELSTATHSRITDDGIDDITNNCQYLKNVNFDDCEHITAKSFDCLIDRCHSLKSISILGKNTNCVLEDEQIYLLSEKGSKIETLRANFGSVSSKSIQYLVDHGSSLKNLVISGWNSLDSQILETLINGLPHLEQVSILGENSTSLQNMDIQNSSLNRISFANLKSAAQLTFKCPNLRHLRFDRCGDISLLDDDLYLPSLTQLIFRSCSLLQMDTQKVSKFAPHLEALELVDCGMMPRSIIQIDSSTLRYINLFVCRNVFHVRLHCPHLDTLNIDILKDIRHLDIDCPAIKQLQLLRVPYIEYPNLNTMHIHTNSIQSLNLQRCTALENATIQGSNLDALNMAGCRSLRSLQVNCPKLDKLALGSQVLQFDDSFIQHIISCCPQVSMFSVLSPQINDRAISELCAHWHNLQALVLSNCHSLVNPLINSTKLKGIQITDCGSLENMKLETPSLSKLFLRNCPRIHDYSIESMLLSCPLVKFCEIHHCSVISPSLTNQSLIEIQFNNCRQLQQPNIDCSSVKKLTFANCPHLTSITSPQGINTLSELLFLHCPQIDDAFIQTMSIRSENIVLSNCDKIQRPSFYVSSQQNIQFLQCGKLVKPLLLGSSKMKNLVFSRCDQLNFKSSNELGNCTIETMVLDKCHQFEQLEVNSPIENIQICESTSMYNFELNCHEIQRLQVKQCPKLKHISVTSSKLSILALEGCPCLSDITPNHTLNLKALSLSECHSINDTAIMTLMNAAPSLYSAALSKLGVTTPVIIHHTLQVLKIHNAPQLHRLFIDGHRLQSLTISGSPQLSQRDIVLLLGGKPCYCPESSITYGEDGLYVSLKR